MLKNSKYIPEFYKVVASVRLANSAKEWIEYMRKFKGGIYNS